MKTHKYKNYAEYVAAQKRGFKQKREKVWASEENIKFLADWLKARKPQIGICHGVRGGQEVDWFIKYLGYDIFGTELGGSTGPYICQWDFNDKNHNWIRYFDFIYSNSFDHAYDPKATLNVWAGQLKPSGVIILEWSARHEHTGKAGKKYNATDPVSITLAELINKIPEWVKGANVIDVLNMPVVKKDWQVAIVVEVG